MRHVGPVRERRQPTETEQHDRDSFTAQAAGDQRMPEFVHQDRNERRGEPQNPFQNVPRPSEQHDQ